jgi:hypothetical protein
MKRNITSESLFEFAKFHKAIDENLEIGSKDEEWYGEDMEDEEVIDDIEHVDLGTEIVVDDEELDDRLSKVEQLDTYKTLLKHLKTIIDINKGKPDKDKNYITFTVRGKPNDSIDGIPFDVKGTKDQTTVTFIRKGTKNIKLVLLKNIILESNHPIHKFQMVKESLNEWSEYENEVEPDNYQDFLFKVANHLVQQWDQEVLCMLDIDEFPEDHEELVVDLVNYLDEIPSDALDLKRKFQYGMHAEDVAEDIANWNNLC